MLSVHSRKTHGVVGDFDLPVDTNKSIVGAVTVEPRSLGSGHVLVFTFDSPITSTSTFIAKNLHGIALDSVTVSPIGNTVVVTLPIVSDNSRVSVSLFDVNGSGYYASASVGFLLGDVNGSREIDSADTVATKAHSGQVVVDSTNAAYDVDLSGAITASDIAAVKARAGNVLSLVGIYPTSGQNSIEGFAIPTPSKVPSIIPATHAGLNGAGANINAWAVDPVVCSNTQPPITRLWRHNIDFVEHGSMQKVDFFDMAPNEALTYKFVAGPAGAGYIFISVSTQVPLVPTFVSLSTSPCDFDATKLLAGPSRDFCYVSAPLENMLYYQETNRSVSFPMCKLVPGQEYYLNLRFQNASAPGADSCAQAGSARCGGILQIRR